MCGTCYILANIIVKKYKKGNSQVQRECLEEMTGMTGNERGHQIFKRQKMDGGKKMEIRKQGSTKREPTVVEVCQKKQNKNKNYNYKTTSQTQKHDFPN